VLHAQDNSGIIDIVPAPAQSPSDAKATSTRAQPAAAQASTQSAADKPAAPKPGDFSKEAVVFDKLLTRIHEEADGTGTRQTTARVRILADAGVKQMAVLTFTYTALNQQVDIPYVRVIKPDGSIVVTPPYNVQDLPADVTRTAPMYSDIHQKHVAVKGLGVGDVLEYQAIVTTIKPEVPGHFWLEYGFEKNFIILDEQLDLDLPADKFFTVASPDYPPAISVVKDRKLYHWSSSNLSRPDPDAPPKSTKHVKPSVQLTTFSSWEQVGAWYQSLQRDSVLVTPAIQSKAAALTRGLTSDDDKIHAIFNDVALHIHYVGLEFGIGRYQPHPADDVISNEYGDCKDKHTLLAAELKAVGIDSWPVLISASRELDPDTPSPAQFNHVITMVPTGGKILWMDSTEEVAPIGVILPILRDKQALAIPTAKPAYLERTPALFPDPQTTLFEVNGKLSSEGRFTGHIAQKYHGDIEVLLRTVFRQVPLSQLKEAVQRGSQAMGFGGEVSNPQMSEIEQTAKPFEFSYDYTREKFREWDDHLIFPAMPPTGLGLMPGIKEKKPADPVDLGSPGELLYKSSIELPRGYSIVPSEGISLKEDWADYKSTYGFKDGIFSAERRLTVKRTEVPLDQWEKYLVFRRAIYADEVRTTRIFNGPTLAGPAYNSSQPFFSAVPDYARGGPHINAELRQQIMDVLEPARSAEQILNGEIPPGPAELAKASTLARQAVDAIETKTATLHQDDTNSIYWMQGLSNSWSALGWAAFNAKDLPTAENYIRAAWRLSQDRQSGYRLGRILEAKGEKQAAAHQYELAIIAAFSAPFGEPPAVGHESGQMVMDAYKNLTGRQLKATPFNDGKYEGSLREELDKMIEAHAVIRTTKINGTAYFIFEFATGKPTRVTLTAGEKSLASLTQALQSHSYPGVMPSGSKATVLRGARVVCSVWAGCDLYFLLPPVVTPQLFRISPEDNDKPVAIDVAVPSGS